jgi:hypothetical protein
MTTRPVGMSADAAQAAIVICDATVSKVILAARPYRNPGASRTVRSFIRARLHPDSGAVR